MKQLLILVAMVGCSCSSSLGTQTGDGSDAGNDEVDVCENVSGSRLKEKIQKTADGVTRFMGIYDSVLKTDCIQGDHFEGPMRCYPSVGRGGVRVYGDSTCTETLVGYAAGENKTIYSTAGVTGCGRIGGYQQVGERQLALDVGSLYSMINDQCVAFEDPGLEYFALSDPLEATDFALFASGVHADRQRISVKTLEGEDGSLWCSNSSSLYDNDLDVSCTKSRAKDSSGRCIVESERFQTLYSDNACNAFSPAVGNVACTDVKPTYTSALGSDECGLTVDVYDVGQAIEEGTMLYSKEENMCSLEEFKPRYQVGASLPVNTFAELDERPEDADGTRVRRMQMTRGDEVISNLHYFYDTRFDVTCFVSEASDGEFRCMPRVTTLSDTVWHSDEACTLPLEAGGQGPCDPDIKFLLEVGANQKRFQVARRTEPTYKKTGDDCELVDSTITILTKAAEVAESSFERFVEVNVE